MEELKSDIKRYSDAYQYERVAQELANQRYIVRLNVLKSHIKSLKHPKAKEEERLEFSETIVSHQAKGRTIIPIDESGFVHSMPRTHGYSH